MSDSPIFSLLLPLSLGIVIISRAQSFSTEVTSLLFGDVLGVTAADIRGQAVAAGLVVLAGGTARPVGAQDKAKIAPPKHLYGHDLRVRPGGNPNFGPDTPRIGVEVFHDETTKAIVAISETGAISVAPAPVGGAVGMDKTCKWLTAHDLNCRKAGEAEFTQKTKKWGVELFQDRGTNRLLYVCESGSVALAPVPGGLVTDRGPKWHHALEPKVRAPEQEKFDSAKKFGMEIFKDENTGGLIYIT